MSPDERWWEEYGAERGANEERAHIVAWLRREAAGLGGEEEAILIWAADEVQAKTYSEWEPSTTDGH